jgi:acyl carrier protein
VREAVVLMREDEPGDKRLVAYVVPAVEPAPLPTDLREALRRWLPEPMVPSDFVTLKSLPLTANGKVDRRALSRIVPVSVRETTGFATPQGLIQEVLAGIWAEVLGAGRVARVGAHDDFFALGGHSLLATQVMSRLRSAFGVEMPLRALFEAPTLSELAARIGQEGRGAQALAPLVPLVPLVPISRSGDLPLSFAQQGLLFLHMLAPGDVSYNMSLGLILRGSLEPARLHGVLRHLVTRHEVLRTTFSFTDEQPVQLIAPVAACELPLLDLSELPGALAEREASRAVEEMAMQPFDLLQGPILRTALLRLHPEEHVLIAAVHHIAMDGWSWGIFCREIAELYEKGKDAKLPGLPVQYADFAVWQRRRLQGEPLARQLEYWRKRLAGLAPVELPADHPRPSVRSGIGATVPVAIAGGLTQSLRTLGRHENATLFMSLLAVFSVLVHHHAKKDQLVIGTDMADRTQTELEGLIGLFINQLVLSFDLSGDPTFREILRQVRRDTLEAYMHQDAPFDRLVELLRPVRDTSRTPLFQLKLVLQNAPFEEQHLQGLSVTALDLPRRTAKFDLLLNLMEAGDGITGHAEYSTDLFEAATIARFLEGFEIVLRSAVEDPDSHLRELEAKLSWLDIQAEEQRDQERRNSSLARARRRVRADQPVS